MRRGEGGFGVDGGQANGGGERAQRKGSRERAITTLAMERKRYNRYWKS